MEILKWIENWFASNCDGDWEHTWGIKIETADNPGWIVTIDLTGTSIEQLTKPYLLVENSERDWYGYKIENSCYKAAGDPLKLQFLLELFKTIVEDNEGHKT